MTEITLRKGEEARILAGHRLVYMNEVDKIEGGLEPGGEARLITASGRLVGRGLASPASKIVLRLFSYDDQPLDRDFFRAKLKQAVDYRASLGFDGSCRLVFGEADGLPGLVVDRYGDYLSLQLLSAGVEARRDMIVELLNELLGPAGIYERSDARVRLREGLPERKGTLSGQVPDEVIIDENGFAVSVDIKDGQKTGHFLDQRENHAAIAPYVKGRTVLDVCCCTGGFGLHAAGYGASAVTACDISQQALDRARQNFESNALKGEFIKSDIFDLLPRFAEEGRKFGVVILDPPAFCKNKSALDGALRGYREINYRAMGLVEEGGYLVTCSCSHYVTVELFYNMLRQSARDARVRARLVERRIQGRDHPVSLAEDESLYLKCAILQITGK